MTKFPHYEQLSYQDPQTIAVSQMTSNKLQLLHLNLRPPNMDGRKQILIS